MDTNNMLANIVSDKLKKADELKEQVTDLHKLEMSEVLPIQQQLQQIYHDVLLHDLEHALDKKIEQDLWNFCFKNFIVSLQQSAREKKNNASIQNKYVWFLDYASGFYSYLILEICAVFNLDLPFLRHDTNFGKRRSNTQLKINQPNRSSCHYICQYCLVHLGDVARYRNQMIQADSFYRQALSLGANSGHPYNQLALLEASRGDTLSAVFYYTRSIAVFYKFPAANNNLGITLMKCANLDISHGNDLNVSEYESGFLKFHAMLYLNQDLNNANIVLKALNHSLTPLIATQEFSSRKLIQMVVVTIFVYNQTNGEAGKILGEYIAGFLNALLVPLYTTFTDDSVLDYLGLPALKVLISWMKCDLTIIQTLNRPHLWRGLCKLLNSLPNKMSAVLNYLSCALPEDYDLQGFLPLDPVLQGLNFSEDHLSDETMKKLRAFRIVKYGEWLAKTDLKPITNVNGKFEESKILSPTASVEPPKSGSGDTWKTRSQNVAMQSLLKKSQTQMVPEAGAVLESQGKSAQGDWWPQSTSKEESSSWLNNQEGTYSLFSGADNSNAVPVLQTYNNAAIQSLWSGPGPSPLERLLEQQKQLRSTSQNQT